MKKISIALGLFVAAFCCLSQDIKISDDLNSFLPTDPSVKIGTLKNGLKYYIRQNAKPENRLELRLAVNVGSNQEDEDQLGLAHFTEHMAFNGTKNFKKNEIVDYLQSVGVRFGADLNAHTSFDETVYKLPIPSDDPVIVEKGFQILEDWAGALTFEHEEIDKERGVVIEEWRLRQGSGTRMLDEYLPVVFKGSRYAKRLPIGTKEILENFEYETIKKFYKDWYRPDLMAVIVVGDMPLDKIEKKVKAHFSKLKNPKQERERIEYGVPDHEGTLVKVITDKEAPNARAFVLYKDDVEERNTLNAYRESIIRNLATTILNNRLSELTQKAEPPFIGAGTYYGSMWSRSKNAFQAYATLSETNILDGLKAMIIEAERADRHGFTTSELERAKLNMLKGYERAYNERKKTENKAYVEEYTRNFMSQEPIPGIAYEYALAKKHLPGIDVTEVTKVIKDLVTEGNRTVVITAPEKEGVVVPSNDDVLAMFKEIKDMEIEAYVEKTYDQDLIKVPPVPGSVIKTEKLDAVDVTKIELSNGIQVFMKKTDFKNDQILMTAYRPGGHSLAEDDIYQSAARADEIVDLGGIADYSAIDLGKMLAGKSLSISPVISNLSEGFNGSSTPEDLETMLQLTHLYFTSPRKDSEAFQAYIARNKAALKNIDADPNYYFRNNVSKVLSQNHLRGGGFPTEEELDQVDIDVALDFYKQRFSNAYGLTFWFIGNIEEETLVPMLMKYLGSLPSKKSEFDYIDRGVRTPEGKVSKVFNKGTEPKSSVILAFKGTTTYDRKEAYHFKSFGEILTNKLIKKLREEIGGVYGAGAGAGMGTKPYDNYSLTVRFGCAPENVDTLVEATLLEIKKIIENGVTEEDLTKIKETQKRTSEVNLKKNGYWKGQLRAFYEHGWDDYEKITDYEKSIDALSSDDIQKVAKKYLDTEDYIMLILNPEN